MAPKLTEVALPFQFQPNKWYHVVLTHSTGSALSSSVVRMFVDGNLEASSRFKYAKVSWYFVLTVHSVCQCQSLWCLRCLSCAGSCLFSSGVNAKQMPPLLATVVFLLFPDVLPGIGALLLSPGCSRTAGSCSCTVTHGQRSCSVVCIYRLQIRSTPAALQLACPAGKVEWAVRLELSAVRWAAYTCLMMC